MEYLVDAISSVEIEHGKTVARSPRDLAEEIRSAYAAAQIWGGQVIASYSMTCEPETHSEYISVPEGAIADCLFLVMELPDGYNEKEARDVKAAQKAREADAAAQPPPSNAAS